MTRLISFYVCLLLFGCNSVKYLQSAPQSGFDQSPMLRVSPQDTWTRALVDWNNYHLPKLSIQVDVSATPFAKDFFLERDQTYVLRLFEESIAESNFFYLTNNEPDFYLQLNIVRYKPFYQSDAPRATMLEKLLYFLPFGTAILRSTVVEVDYRLRSKDGIELWTQKIQTGLDGCTVPRNMDATKARGTSVAAFSESMMGLTLRANFNTMITEAFAKISHKRPFYFIDHKDRNEIVFFAPKLDAEAASSIFLLYPTRNHLDSLLNKQILSPIKITAVDGQRMRGHVMKISPDSVKAGDILLVDKSLA